MSPVCIRPVCMSPVWMETVWKVEIKIDQCGRWLLVAR